MPEVYAPRPASFHRFSGADVETGDRRQRRRVHEAAAAEMHRRQEFAGKKVQCAGAFAPYPTTER
jgi:hypothetical protein